jgi:transcriptional regulator with XRE-family HTH domain
MFIGERIRALREEKNMSHGDVEKRTGLLRCYVSRVENGHTIPALETLEKFARALEVPLYVLLYDGDTAPPPPDSRALNAARNGSWGSHRKDARLLNRMRLLLGRMSPEDRDTVFLVAAKLATRRHHRTSGEKRNKAMAAAAGQTSEQT